MKLQNKPDRDDIIFIIFNDLGIGGVQRKIADISKWLNNSRLNSSYCLFVILNNKKAYDLEDDVFVEEVKKYGAKVYYRPQRRIWRFKFPYTLYLLWKIAFIKPQRILSFMKRYSLIAIVMKYVFFWRRMKVIVSYDNVPSLLIPSQSNKSYKEYLWKVFVKVLFPLADRVILPSNKARLDLVNNFNVPRKITFVNKNWVVQIPKDSKHNKKYDLIYTGRVDPAKNLTYLVDIVKDIKKILPKINVCIVGWGKEIDKIVRLIHQDSLEKNIELVGSQRDVSKFLLSSKVFVLTSHFEGLPISALEAMAHGLPVITTNYPGAEELVVNGRSGHICKNKKQFVRKAVELLKDEKKRRKLGDIAREHVMLNHAEEQLVDFVDLLF